MCSHYVQHGTILQTAVCRDQVRLDFCGLFKHSEDDNGNVYNTVRLFTNNHVQDIQYVQTYSQFHMSINKERQQFSACQHVPDLQNKPVVPRHSTYTSQCCPVVRCPTSDWNLAALPPVPSLSAPCTVWQSTDHTSWGIQHTNCTTLQKHAIPVSSSCLQTVSWATN